MADPLSITLAILPLAVEVLKAYGSVHQKVKVVRNYSVHVEKVRKKIWQQKLLFESFWEVLLKDTRRDGDIAAGMIDDLSHPDWQSLELDQKLQINLSRISACCATTMQEIGQTLEDIAHRLKVFDVLYKHRLEGEPLKETIRRVKRFSCAIKIAFTESEYERTIEELKDQNRVLRQFYDDAQRLRCLGSEEKRVATTKTAPRLSSIRRASAKLHDALTDTDLMTFDRPAAVKLCLEAKEVGAAICLDLVICKTQLLADCTQKVSVFPLRQITVEAVELNDNTKVSMLETGRKRGHGELSPSVPAKSRKIAGAHGTKLLNDQKNVASSFMLLGPDLNGLDLTMHKNIYHELMHKACKSTTSETYCPGLYETSTDSYKHVFHSSMECSMRACCSPIVPRSASILSLHEALQKPMHEIIGMTDRLKLAKSLALGLLQFHGTGWLTEQWSSRDVAIFSEDGQFSGNALRSLHYTKALPNSLQSLLRQESEAAEKENSKSGERDVATIRNLELYNLGVQLLRIAQWSELDDMNPTKAREIIKKQSIHPPLGGQKYFNFARRCIECDFGYGDRLDDPDLQRAVYAGVEDINQLIEELEKLGL